MNGNANEERDVKHLVSLCAAIMTGGYDRQRPDQTVQEALKVYEEIWRAIKGKEERAK